MFAVCCLLCEWYRCATSVVCCLLLFVAIRCVLFLVFVVVCDSSLLVAGVMVERRVMFVVLVFVPV